MLTSINTVIFDYGCVLSLAPGTTEFEPLRKATGAEFAAFEHAYWRNRDAYDLGDFDASGYWAAFARDLGAEFSSEQVLALTELDCQIWAQPNPVMIEWVRILHLRGYKTAVISNMSRTVGDHLRRTARWFELFNVICFSGELKLLKPDPAIFHACLNQLGEPAKRTLFIDDREVNVAGALATSMNAVVFRSAPQLQQDLAPYGLAESLAEAQARTKLSIQGGRATPSP